MRQKLLRIRHLFIWPNALWRFHNISLLHVWRLFGVSAEKGMRLFGNDFNFFFRTEFQVDFSSNDFKLTFSSNDFKLTFLQTDFKSCLFARLTFTAGSYRKAFKVWSKPCCRPSLFSFVFLLVKMLLSLKSYLHTHVE